MRVYTVQVLMSVEVHAHNRESAELAARTHSGVNANDEHVDFVSIDHIEVIR